jgi:threonine/homoserine/homoserine lactone efflux protein
VVEVCRVPGVRRGPYPDPGTRLRRGDQEHAQFITPGAGLGWLLVLAWSHAVIGFGYLQGLVTGLHGARRLLTRRKVRRGLDAATGAVLLGFSVRLAAEHA